MLAPWHIQHKKAKLSSGNSREDRYRKRLVLSVFHFLFRSPLAGTYREGGVTVAHLPRGHFMYCSPPSLLSLPTFLAKHINETVANNKQRILPPVKTAGRLLRPVRGTGPFGTLSFAGPSQTPSLPRSTPSTKGEVYNSSKQTLETCSTTSSTDFTNIFPGKLLGYLFCLGRTSLPTTRKTTSSTNETLHNRSNSFLRKFPRAVLRNLGNKHLKTSWLLWLL